ncbi:MAG TPA: universal stress protein [Solirubrobacterales bacterium]|jgi:nucleotide-binding universal stress UspA family protein
MSPDEKPVLIAYDGSDHAKHAVEQAGAELRTPRKAVVVAAFEPLGSVPFWGGSRAIVPDELLESVREEAGKTAEEGAELARAAGFDATSRAEGGDRTWRTILDAAKEIDAGLIVLGSHGRGTVGSAVLGSVATAVAQHAHLPILICRPAGD